VGQAVKYIKVFRCRLCRLLFPGRALHQGIKVSLAAAQHELSEHSYEGLEHDEHLCSDGSVGIADLAGYRLREDGK
jgi:hypothetical protein